MQSLPPLWWRIRFGALPLPGAASNLPATRPAPALVMAGEVQGPTALALAKVVMVMATSTMVGLPGKVQGGLSPPDSSRDGTDFHHFPATTEGKGEFFPSFHTFTFTFCESMTSTWL